MKSNDPISCFVRQALAAGQAPDSICAALKDAGWPESVARQALAAWASVPGLPPVPRPRPYVSARQALLYGLLFLSLAVVCWHICALGIALIDRLLPDADQYGGPMLGALRLSVATLLTFVPLFLLLDRRARRLDAAGPKGARSLVRRWLASVMLFAAALALLVDLSLTVFALLSGELTLRFALKAGLVALTAVLIFAYYRDEMDV